MKKFLLSLLTVVCLGFAANATDVKVTFSELGYANAADVTTVKTGDDNISIKCAKSTGNNPPKYYNSGTALRMYANNTLSVSTPVGSNFLITKIQFEMVSGKAFSGTVANGNYSNGVWTGETDDVTFTPTTGQWHIISMTVTYEAAGGPAKTPVTLSWSKESETLNLGDEFVAPTLMVDPAEAAGDVELNAEGLLSVVDGQIVLGEGAGQGSVTASINSGAYYGESVTYTVTVVDPNATEVTIEYSKLGYSNAEVVNTVNTGNAVISIVCAKGSSNNAPAYYNTGTGLRMYNGNTMTIKTNGNYEITEITFTASETSYVVKGSVDKGVLTQSGVVSTWTGNASEVVLTSSSTCRLQTMTIKYSKLAPKAVDDVVISYELVDYEAQVSLACATVGASIYYGFASDAITNLYTAPFTIDGTKTIYAYAEKEGEKGAVSFKEVVVPVVYRQFKDLIKNGSKDGDKIVAVGDFEVIYQNGANTIVTDGKSNILIYDYNTTPAVGTKISKIEAAVTIYSQLFELTGATLTEGGEGAEYETRKLTTLKDVNYDDQLFDQVVVEGATISGVSGQQGTLNLNGETIAMYDKFGVAGYANTAAGETVTVTGFVWRNNSTLQIDPISIVKEESGKVDAKLAWSVEEYTVVEYTEVSEGLPVLTNPLGIEVVYESSDEDVVMFEDGLLKSFTSGTATITATPADTDKYYGSASFTVTVTAKPHLGAILVNGKEVKDDQTIDVALSSKITFSAENAEMIEYKIEGDEGTVAGEIVEDSSCTFTAPAALGEYMVTLSATGCGEGAEVVFMLNVVEKPAITEETLNFLENSYGMERLSGTTSQYNEAITKLSDTEFTYIVNDHTRLWSDGLRLYKDGVVSVAVPLGYQIEKVNLYDKNSNLGVSNVKVETAHHKATATVTYTAGSSNSAISKMSVTIVKVDAPDAESYSPDHSSFVASPNGDGSINIEITHADKHAAIYYKHTAADQPAQARRRVASHEGYEVADATVVDEKSVHSFTVPSAGNVEYYAYHTATDTKGDVKTITVDANGGVTSITELTVDLLDAAAPAYDLQGRRVAAPTRGLYIQNGRKLFLR